MPFWLDDILHEIGTVIPWLFFWFGLSWCFGYFVRGHLQAFVFRFGVFLVTGGLWLFTLFMFFPEHLELELIIQLFLLFFLWGVVIGFENCWIPLKDLFCCDFWFPWKKRNMSSLYPRENKKRCRTIK